jgi:Sortase domain
VALAAASFGLAQLLPPVTGGGIGGAPPALALAPAITPVDGPAAAPGAGLAASLPVRVELPTLGVRAPVVPVDLDSNGAMEVPAGTSRAGWYDRSPAPGESGPSVLVAHVDWAGELGVFHDIGRLSRGDVVRVARQDGTVVTFRVDRVAEYSKRSLPTATVFGPLDRRGLRLITCGGAFDRSTGSYVDNVVAFATAVS